MIWARRTAAFAVLLCVLALAAPAMLAVLMLVIAETIPARLFAGALILFYVALSMTGLALRIRLPSVDAAMEGLGSSWPRRTDATERVPPSIVAKHRRRRWSVPLSFFCAGTALLVWCCLLEPPGTTAPNASAQSVFLAGRECPRWLPTRLVPEIDQLKLAVTLVPFLDAYTTRAKARRLNSLLAIVYGEMANDRDFAALGSAMHYAYADLLGLPFDVGHLYVYIPTNRPQDRMPVVLFLHGSVGNFKGYVWVLKQVADRCHVAIVAPTFGFGNWSMPGGVEAIERAREFCARNPLLDTNRIVLAGLSNGGLGVTRAGGGTPANYRGFIYISGVIENDPAFAAAAKGMPLLIIHGAEDERIPRKYIDEAINGMRQQGLAPEVTFYADEDHFLIFSKRNEVARQLSAWLQTNRLSGIQ